MKISATLPSPVTRSHFHMSSYVATSFPWPFFVHCTDAQCDRGNTRTPTRAAISILVVFGSLITRHPMHRGAAHSILHRKFRLIHCFALSLSLSLSLAFFLVFTLCPRLSKKSKVLVTGAKWCWSSARVAEIKMDASVK